MMTPKHSHVALGMTLFISLCASTGCSSEPLGEMNLDEAQATLRPEQDATASVDTGAQAPKPFTTIHLDAGRRIDFIDLGDGDIGIGEVGPSGGVSLVNEITGRWEATPLELYKALEREGRPAPKLLVDAHRAQVNKLGRAELAARSLPVDYLVGTGVNAYPAPNCGLWHGTYWHWVADWNGTYSSNRDVSAAAFLQAQDVSSGYNFYAGANKSSATNMGLCVDHLWESPSTPNENLTRFRVYSKTTGTASGCGSSDWTSIYDANIDENYSANFYTSSITGKFVCAKVNSAYAPTTTRDIGIGTAYTDLGDISGVQQNPAAE